MKKASLAILTILFILLAAIAPVKAASVDIRLKTTATAVQCGDALTLTLNIQSAVPVAVLDLRIEYDEDLLDCIVFGGLEPLASDTEILTDLKADDNCLHLVYLDSEGGQSGIQNGDFFSVKFLVYEGQSGKTANINVNVLTAGDAHAKPLSTSGASLQIPIGTTTSTPRTSDNKPAESAATTSAAAEPTNTTKPDITDITTSASSESSVTETTATTTGPTEQPKEGNPQDLSYIILPTIAGTVLIDAGIVMYILKKRRG